jgi:hypothetical protein
MIVQTPRHRGLALVASRLDSGLPSTPAAHPNDEGVWHANAEGEWNHAQL